jgi:hypothetical protein
LASASALIWISWDSRADGYAGLSINILGQVLGDLLVAGLALSKVLSWRNARDRQCRDHGDATVSGGSEARAAVGVDIILIRGVTVGDAIDDVLAAVAIRGRSGRMDDRPVAAEDLLSLVLRSRLSTGAWDEVGDGGSSRVA